MRLRTSLIRIGLLVVLVMLGGGAPAHAQIASGDLLLNGSFESQYVVFNGFPNTHVAPGSDGTCYPEMIDKSVSKSDRKRFINLIGIQPANISQAKCS